MSAAAMQQRTKATFDRLADRDGAVVVYPEALGDPRWSDGWWGAPGGTSTDDVGFLAALIDALVAELGVDRKRVFAAGLSNGAAMVYRLACERPDLVAAVAPVAGGMPPHVARACAQGAPVSIIGMHGTDDPIVAFDPSIRDGIAAWAKRDGCPAQPTSSRLPDTDPGDGTQTRAAVFAPCAAGTEVAFYTIEGGGHAWPGGTSPLGFVRRGTTPHDFDAGVLIGTSSRSTRGTSCRSPAMSPSRPPAGCSVGATSAESSRARRGAEAGCSSTRNGPPARCQPTRAIQVSGRAVAGVMSVATGARCHPEKCGPELRGSTHAGARRCLRKLSNT